MWLTQINLSPHISSSTHSAINKEPTGQNMRKNMRNYAELCGTHNPPPIYGIFWLLRPENAHKSLACTVPQPGRKRCGTRAQKNIMSSLFFLKSMKLFFSISRPWYRPQEASDELSVPWSPAGATMCKCGGNGRHRKPPPVQVYARQYGRTHQPTAVVWSPRASVAPPPPPHEVGGGRCKMRAGCCLGECSESTQDNSWKVGNPGI